MCDGEIVERFGEIGINNVQHTAKRLNGGS